MKQEGYDQMTEELNSAETPVKKEMLLQKYGLVEPKLTQNEKYAVNQEEAALNGWPISGGD